MYSLSKNILYFTFYFGQSNLYLPGNIGKVTGFLDTAYYGYELRKNDKGIRYFDIGPEIITCSAVTSPEINLSPELLQVLYNDKILYKNLYLRDRDVRKCGKEKREEARANALCSLVKEAYKVVIHNLRALARVVPASAFFKDV